MSDLALLWMIARVADLTGLEFDDEYIKQHFWPCAACSLYRSNRGWLVSGLLPFHRAIPAHLKIPASGAERLINAKVHWSVKQRRGRSALVDQTKYLKYTPTNLPEDVDFTEPTELERGYMTMCRSDAKHKKRKTCALYRDLPAQQGWLDRWRTRRLRRFRDEWAKDQATPG